jgi:hypothetical protein
VREYPCRPFRPGMWDEQASDGSMFSLIIVTDRWWPRPCLYRYQIVDVLHLHGSKDACMRACVHTGPSPWVPRPSPAV